MIDSSNKVNGFYLQPLLYVFDMKAIFYNYQTENEERGDIFTTDIELIPLKNDVIALPWGDNLHYPIVVEICHCFNLKGEFTHIDIEVSNF